MVKNIKPRGFTLIEILVVIGIIAILAAVVIIAINPARQFAQARNSQRQSNVESILNAIGQNMADNKGIFTCSGQTILSIGGAASSSIGKSTAANFVDLSTCLAPYLPAGIPTDPVGGSDQDSGYQVTVDSGRYLVCAPKSDEAGTLALGSDLCVKR